MWYVFIQGYAFCFPLLCNIILELVDLFTWIGEDLYNENACDTTSIVVVVYWISNFSWFSLVTYFGSLLVENYGNIVKWVSISMSFEKVQKHLSLRIVKKSIWTIHPRNAELTWLGQYWSHLLNILVPRVGPLNCY